jgi:two-component system, chemotaxis family, chemotaxis protein CheY
MGYQVLIVEDNEPALNMMVDMLQPMRITNITKVANGALALNKVQFQKFDLIICDFNMPVMSGLDFFYNAQQGEFIKNTPFLMVSAENDKNKIVKALSSGINDYLVKPFSQAMFSSKVKKLLKISMEIHWDESFVLGNEVIDNDHKHLVALLNAINSALDCSVSCDDLLTHLSLLENHCKDHFQREEDIMVNIGSQELTLHRSNHQSTLNQLRGLYEEIKSKKNIEECRETVPFVELLSGWVIRDILDEDKKLKHHFINANR